MEHIWWV